MTSGFGSNRTHATLCSNPEHAHVSVKNNTVFSRQMRSTSIHLARSASVRCSFCTFVCPNMIKSAHSWTARLGRNSRERSDAVSCWPAPSRRTRKGGAWRLPVEREANPEPCGAGPRRFSTVSTARRPVPGCGKGGRKINAAETGSVNDIATPGLLFRLRDHACPHGGIHVVIETGRNHPERWSNAPMHGSFVERVVLTTRGAMAAAKSVPLNSTPSARKCAVQSAQSSSSRLVCQNSGLGAKCAMTTY